MNIEELFIAKSKALLHDPPFKMCVLARHEEEARRFREEVLRGVYPLGYGIPEKWDYVISLADNLASSFDRWILNVLYETSADRVIIKFSKFLNIFNPTYISEDIECPDNICENALEVARELNNVLRPLSDLRLEESERAKLEYMLLYTILEPLWVSRGLPISLADTRAPTHSIFDHLYATTSILNLVYSERFSGYLIKLDIPSVQKFINAARKAGDFWAGSWILSNLIWKTLKPLIIEYGPDILVSPSPRLNPYLMLTVIEELEKIRESAVGNDKKIITETLSRICKIYRKLLESLGFEEIIEKVKKTINTGDECRVVKNLIRFLPIIPATAIIILPEIGLSNEEEIQRKITENYIAAWREIVKDVRSRLCKSMSEHLEKSIEEIVVCKLVERFADSLQYPPVGIEATIMSLRELYDDLKNCIEYSKACEKLNIDRSKLEELFVELDKENIKIERVKLAEKLLWTIALTNALKVASIKSLVPVLRPFWVLDNNVLKPTIYLESPERWRPCSLDGEEPAVIYLGKRTKNGIVDFNEDKLKDLLTQLGIKHDIHRERVSDVLKALIKPGEALGLYCLFKRLVYRAYSTELKKILGFESTDDVALALLDKFLSDTPEILKQLTDIIYCRKRGFDLNMCKYLQKGDMEWDKIYYFIGRYVFPETWLKAVGPTEGAEVLSGRDVREAADKIGVNHNTFVQLLNDALRSICEEDREKSIIKNVLDNYKYYVKNISKYEEESIKALASRLCHLRTSYVIIKADADDMGSLMSGVLEPLKLTTKKYTELVINAISESGKIFVNDVELHGARRNEALQEISRFFDTIARIAEVLYGSKNRVILSPTYTYALSTALIISSLKDTTLILESGGFPVYSGGDDLLALLPIDTALIFSLRSRKEFHGDRMFLYVQRENRKYPILSMIPTGRSYSLRFAQLMDVLAEEARVTVNILEDKAKGARWSSPINVVKDTIALSDSRCETLVLVPLSKWSDASRELIINEVGRAISLLYVASKTGVLSPGLPEDFEKRIFSSPSEGIDIELLSILEKNLDSILEYVIDKNIKVRTDKYRKMWIKNDIIRALKELPNSKEEGITEGIPLILFILNSLKILRGYP